MKKIYLTFELILVLSISAFSQCNPTTSEFKIDLNKELPFTILLQSFDGQAKKEIKDYYGGKSIDVSGLKPGDYSVSIYHEGKPVSKQRLIISKK